MANQSLAEATIEAGESTTRHHHRVSEEIYYLVEGTGEMELDGEVRAVGPGDAILIPARVVAHDPGHRRRAGAAALRLRTALVRRRHLLRLRTHWPTADWDPDPDDAFMFYALAHDKLDTRPTRFRHESCRTSRRSTAGPARRAGGHRRSASTPTPTCWTSTPCCRRCSMGDRYGPMVVVPAADRVEDLAARDRRPRAR